MSPASASVVESVPIVAPTASFSATVAADSEMPVGALLSEVALRASLRPKSRTLGSISSPMLSKVHKNSFSYTLPPFRKLKEPWEKGASVKSFQHHSLTFPLMS